MNKMKYKLIFIFTIAGFLQSNAQEKYSKEKIDSIAKLFDVVQVPAEFPEGLEGWATYLEKNLNVKLGIKHVKVPKGKKIGKATVILSFIIDKEGNVSEVKAEETIPQQIHPSLVKEAIRVIKNGPKWIPATQDGKAVKYRHRQSISWQVTEE